MRLVFTTHAWDDYCAWQRQDRATLKRINRLIEDCLRDPFDGIGKPERLKYGILDACSRRITAEHRLVYLVDGYLVDGYLVDGDDLIVLQCRYHYEK